MVCLSESMKRVAVFVVVCGRSTRGDQSHPRAINYTIIATMYLQTTERHSAVQTCCLFTFLPTAFQNLNESCS